MNYKLTRPRLLKLITAELRAILKTVGPCDHAKGVCYCEARRLVELSEAIHKSKKRIV